MDERTHKNSDSTYFRIYLLVVGVYTAVRAAFAFLAKIPALHVVSELSDRWPFFQFFKWIYQVCMLASPHCGFSDGFYLNVLLCSLFYFRNDTLLVVAYTRRLVTISGYPTILMKLLLSPPSPTKKEHIF